jgi:trichoplein keratin filament-binding protein
MLINRDRRFQQDQQLNSLKGYVKQNTMDREKNAWLHKPNPQEAYVHKKSALQARSLKKETLAARRQKLKRLIFDEDQKYRSELMGKTKTPDQVREEMRERVESLKIKSANERQEEANRLLDVQFRANAEELRMINQKANEIKTQIEREIQMAEKQKMADYRVREDQVYAEITKQEIREKVQKERELRDLYLKKIQERNIILGKQLEDFNEKKKADICKLEEDKQNFNEQCKTLLLDERQKIIHQKELNRKIAEEVKAYNDFQKLQKEEQVKQEKSQDKVMLQNELNREAALKELERAQREKFKKDAHVFFVAVKKRAEEMRINEKLIDRLIAEEIERQFRKQQDIWDREEKARTKLMKEVYSHRYENIEDKKKAREMVKVEKEKEKIEINNKVFQFEKEEKDIIMDEFRKMKLYHDQIMRQIQDKYELKKREMFKEMEEERKRKIAEFEYQQKIAAAMQEGEQLIEDIKKLRDLIN